MTLKIGAARRHIGGVEFDQCFLIESRARHSACRTAHARFLDEVVFIGVVEVCQIKATDTVKCTSRS